MRKRPTKLLKSSTQRGCDTAARSIESAAIARLVSEKKPLSALRGEREGPGRAGGREGEVGRAAAPPSDPSPCPLPRPAGERIEERVTRERGPRLEGLLGEGWAG